jgi:hypothetical protein
MERFGKKLRFVQKGVDRLPIDRLNQCVTVTKAGTIILFEKDLSTTLTSLAKRRLRRERQLEVAESGDLINLATLALSP